MARKAAAAGTKVSKAEYYALSNTAVDGRHFLAGDLITGVTDRDQLALALRTGVIGTEPPAPAGAPEVDDFADKPEVSEDAELTGEGGDDAATDLGDRDAD